MSTDLTNFLLGGGATSAKFEQPGDTISGTITEVPELRQQTEFGTNKPLFWDDGQPRMQLVVRVKTDLRAEPDDDGVRALYVKGEMQKAVGNALVAALGRAEAKARGLEVGAKLSVTYTGLGKAEKGFNPPKLYTATYEAPNPSAGFLGAGAQQGIAQPAAAEDPDAAYLRTKGIDPSTVGDIHHVAALQRQLEQSIAS